jgi:hypothetical protein
MGRKRIGVGQERVLLGLVAAAVASCAGILGIDDRSMDPELVDGSVVLLEGGAPGEDGSSSGDAGTAPPPGSDAAGADAPNSTGGDATVPGEDTGTTPVQDTGTTPLHDTGASPPDTGVTGPACATPCLMASGLNHPFLMTSDTSSVYWTEFGDDQGSGNGSVKACPLSGCGSGPTVYAIGLTNPRGIAVDSTHLYYATASYGGVVGGIWTCPLSGCANSPTMLAMAGIPFGLAVDSSFVYWVDNDDGTVHKVSKTPGGGSVDHTLYDAASGLLIEPGECVVDGTFLFFTDSSADAWRLSTNGGEPVFLGTSDFGGQFGITTDPNYVYFGGSGVITRSLKTLADGGVPISHAVATPNGLAFESTSNMLYWSNWGSGNSNDGTVGKMSTDGGGAHVLAASLVTPEAVTVSGSYVFWISNGTLNEAGTGAEPNTGALWHMAK